MDWQILEINVGANQNVVHVVVTLSQHCYHKKSMETSSMHELGGQGAEPGDEGSLGSIT